MAFNCLMDVNRNDHRVLSRYFLAQVLPPSIFFVVANLEQNFDYDRISSRYINLFIMT